MGAEVGASMTTGVGAEEGEHARTSKKQGVDVLLEAINRGLSQTRSEERGLKTTLEPPTVYAVPLLWYHA